MSPALLTLVLAGGLGPSAGDGAPLDFGRDVRPILSQSCLPCHGPDPEHRERGLRLDTFEGATAERDGKRAVVPGDSARSEAFLRITGVLERMPPEGSGRSLGAREIETLRRWIDAGAEYEPHWAFVAPERPPAPAVQRADWPRNELDRFVLARLEAEGLAPSPEADRYTLVRRLSLDLTGLPPEPDEVAAFVGDARPDAYERLVERLLASPHYGERWARVWLDIARYADSAGHGSDPLRVIWRYRDWVIRAFNENKPYDQFTVEQLAGDLLPDPTVDQRLATAFHRNTLTNTEGGTDDEEFRVAAVKDRAIVTAQAWMGLTVGCAQCHTHKYDPLTQEEFYSLFAFFNQTADRDAADDRPRLETPTAEEARRLDELRAEIAALEAQLADPRREVSAALAAWEAERREHDRAWRVLAPEELSSAGGAELVPLVDGSVLATGPAAEKDVYTVVATSPLERVTAVRLELLSDERLAFGGPGRRPGIGNAILNDLRLRAGPTPGARAEAPRARYVRVTNFGEGALLSLAEVEVESAGRNVALEKTARQSSTAFDGPARLAVDGQTNGHYFDGRSVTHTATERDPWWEVDLGTPVPLERVRIWNRTDGGLEHRLADFEVSALDDQRRVVWSTWVRAAPRPSLELDLARGAGEVRFASASADFSDPEWGVERAIDADPGGETGWGLNPALGGAHTAVFEVAGELAGPRLELALHQEFGAHHTYGRFRLSVTDLVPPPRALSGGVAHALATPAARRGEREWRVLRRHYQTIDPGLARLRGRVAALESEIQALGLVTTPVMVELPPAERRATHVLQGGNFLSPGAAVEPGVPAAFHPFPAGAPRNRLGLARWVVDPANPLTARVAVNRWWAQLFGAGLVATEEDFGTQGALPTHRALLDWLAVEYLESGWDTQALLRTLVISATYRQASDVLPVHLERDPENRLYARGPRFRMEAEMVRDVALSVSGLLSREIGGPSVYPPQPDGLWQAAFNGQRDWPESRGADRWRRGLYVFLRRTIPYPSLATFDAPSRETCTFRRTRTSTPLQAFVTLNDPVFVEAAQALGRRIVREGGEDTRARIAHGLELCLQRPADERRVEVLAELFESERAHYADRAAEALALASEPLGPLPEGWDAAELAAWTVVANVMLNQDAVLTKD